jgi:SH3-like domain-containing protein
MRYAHKTDSRSIFRSFFPGNISLRYLLASLSILCFASLLTPLQGAAADTAKQNTLSERTVIRGSGYPVPRFVTLKKDLAYLRVGPGREYQLDWVYVRQNLPLKVISEFDVWRKVVDHDGTTGWLHSSLLSLKRFGLVTKAEIKLYDSPKDSSKIVAVAGRNVLLEVQYCEKQWCRLATNDVRGWTKRQNFWGVLENEEVE